ncbi:MAG: DUF4282 domain-containing protein [Thermoplasmatota archaeon]
MARRRSAGNYFKFRWMITPDIIRIIYVLGMIFLFLLNIILVIGAIVTLVMFSSEIGMDSGMLIGAVVGTIIVGLILMILTNLLFRMYCEQIILFFSMHEILEDISINTEPPEKGPSKQKKSRSTGAKKLESEWADEDDD